MSVKLSDVFYCPRLGPDVKQLNLQFRLYFAEFNATRDRQADPRPLRSDGDAHLLADFIQLVQMAGPNVPRNDEEDYCAEIASRSICVDASTSGNLLHRHGFDGDAGEHI